MSSAQCLLFDLGPRCTCGEPIPYTPGRPGRPRRWCEGCRPPVWPRRAETWLVDDEPVTVLGSTTLVAPWPSAAALARGCPPRSRDTELVTVRCIRVRHPTGVEGELYFASVAGWRSAARRARQQGVA